LLSQRVNVILTHGDDALKAFMHEKWQMHQLDVFQPADMQSARSSLASLRGSHVNMCNFFMPSIFDASH
jgi:hypothetical protein